MRNPTWVALPLTGHQDHPLPVAEVTCPTTPMPQNAHQAPRPVALPVAREVTATANPVRAARVPSPKPTRARARPASPELRQAHALPAQTPKWTKLPSLPASFPSRKSLPTLAATKWAPVSPIPTPAIRATYGGYLGDRIKDIIPPVRVLQEHAKLHARQTLPSMIIGNVVTPVSGPIRNPDAGFPIPIDLYRGSYGPAMGPFPPSQWNQPHPRWSHFGPPLVVTPCSAPLLRMQPYREHPPNNTPAAKRVTWAKEVETTPTEPAVPFSLTGKLDSIYRSLTTTPLPGAHPVPSPVPFRMPKRDQATWNESAPPGKINKPLKCSHSTCDSQLQWSDPNSLFTNCHSCQRVAYVSTRRIDRPNINISDQLPSLSVPLIYIPVSDSCPPSVDDHRWASARQLSPRGPIYLYRATQLAALIPYRWACFWRALYLISQPTLSNRDRPNENDATAYLISLALHPLAPQLTPPQTPFRGDQHTFASFLYHTEPGFYRPAALPVHIEEVTFGDPSTSAYTAVSQFGSPLSPVGFESAFTDHPFGLIWANHIRFGFPLLSEPEWTTVQPRYDQRRLYNDPRLLAANNLEFDDGAFLRVPKFNPQSPLRYNPWFHVDKEGSGPITAATTISRGICDLSDNGPRKNQPSVNDTSSRRNLVRARLARWQRIAARILYMKKQRPGQKIVLAKLDVHRGYRNCPLAVRDFWKTAHLVNGETIVNTRLMLGATCSGDLMAMGVSILADKLGMSIDTFIECFIDDQMIVEYEDRFDTTMDALLLMWSITNWPRNAKKFAAEGRPHTSAIFLGVLIDTLTCIASITAKRKIAINSLLQTWLDGSKFPSEKAYRQLAGTLNFIADTIPFGRVFAKHFYDPGQWNTELSPIIKQDIAWWIHAISFSNGTACFNRIYANSFPNRHVATDAAKFGVGAVDPFAQEWMSDLWTPSEQSSNIAAREFAGILLACKLWGPSVSGGFLFVHSDSAASVSVLSSLSANNPLLSSLLRVAVLLQLAYKFRLVVRHIRGCNNGLADAASRECTPPAVFGTYQKLPVPSHLRQLIGSLLLSKLPASLNLAQFTTQLQRDVSMHTARTKGTKYRPILPWTLWSSLRWDSPDMGAFSTSPSGSVPHATSEAPPSILTSPQSVKL